LLSLLFLIFTNLKFKVNYQFIGRYKERKKILSPQLELSV